MKTSTPPGKYLILLALIGCFGLVPAVRVAASTGIFQIIGHVRDDSSNAIAGVDIAVDDYVGDVYFGTTDTNGFYTVNVDADSNYRATVDCTQLTAKGFECPAPVAMTINDGGLELDFMLQAAQSGPLQITNISLPNANVGAPYTVQLGAIGGKAPYSWQLAADSSAIPDGLFLNSSGLLSGVPTTNTGANLKLQLTDSNLTVTNKTLLLIINLRPFLSALAWTTNRFFMRLVGASNQNYTIQASANMSAGWTSLFVTNNPEAGEFVVTDLEATNSQKVYRVLIGP
jgi:hypothetical protein